MSSGAHFDLLRFIGCEIGDVSLPRYVGIQHLVALSTVWPSSSFVADDPLCTTWEQTVAPEAEVKVEGVDV